MSRVIQQIATVQFQVDNRKVTASMNALQTEAESLNGKIAAVKQNIKSLGDVPADNKFLLEYQKQLRQLNTDLKDVTAAQRDLMKGVKAADQLWKAARTQDIESLSIKAIKAGQNGLRKRMENLRPELGGDEQKMYDAYKAVIDEADRVMNVFKSNYAAVVKTIRDGGIVSEQAMKSTRDALRDLMESEKEGTAEHRQLAQQYDFLNESLANVAEMRRREKGEIVNANDARREALKLTEDGIAAARRERDMADAVIAGMQQQKSDLEQQRKLHEDRIAQTEREIAANQRLEEVEQDRLADVEKAMRYNENEDRKSAILLRKRAEAAKEEAEVEKEAYEQQAEQEKLLRQHVKDTGDEVTALTAKIEALGKTEQQKADHTTNLAQVQELYNQKMEERIRLEKELKDIQGARYDDDPHIKQLNAEIAKLEELLAVSDKYKKQFAKMSDEKFESGYMGKDEGKRSIWEAQKYLEGAYDDKLLKAPLAERDDLPNSPEYKEAAKRVAGGIMQNAQENVRRVIFDQIKNGTWTAESMQEQLEGMRNMMYQAGNSELGLKNNPEYNAYKFIIAQMEKYIEVAKKVQEERKQIADSNPFLETAQRESDYDKNIWPESLSRQKEKREYQEVTGYTRWNEDNKDRERRKSEEVRKAEEEEAETKRNLNEVKKESTQADQQSVDVAKQKKELEGQLEEAKKKHTKAEADYEAQQERSNNAQEKAYKAQEEAVAIDEKATKAESDVAHAEEKHNEVMEKQSEHLRQIRADGQRLLDQYEQQKSEIQNVDKAWADADVKQGEAEARKAQNQELTTKSIEDSIRKLKEANAVIDTNSDEWEENTRIIQKLQQAQDEISQKQKEMTGEWMSYAEAEKFAAQAGTEGFIATGQQMQQAQQALERQRDTLIKSIQAKRQEKNMTDEQKKALAAEEAQLDKVNAELKKMKFEMDNTNMSAKRMKEILDNPSSAKNIEELGQAVKRAQAQLKMMEDTVGNTNEEYKEMAQKTKEAAQRQKELEVQFKASASAFDKAWSRLKTYIGLYVGAAVAMQKLTSTMGDLMDLSDKMGEVRKTTGFTADEVGRLSGELKKFDTRTTLNGLLDLSVAAGQLGLKTEEDVLGFTEAANKLMVALPEMGKEGATEMLKVALATGEIDKIRKQMEQGLIDGSSATAVAMEKVGSTIDRLRATSAATAPAITDFVKRVGAVGAQSGITIDQVAALGSTVDALGMRVEMSATALSRMIPAIRNNAFDVAKAIGVTPDTLRNLFDAGRGMEAILMVFQHIKDAGMGEDDIESMLGMGNMKEVMKELNQMGARAGIVFSGLSQNVDELRRQLGVAGEAYEQNIAIQQEYDKMNETTLAKWERLKNTIEEAFVGDFWQRQLGNLIDGIRSITDFITGNVNPALKTISTLLWMIVAGLAAVKTNFGEILFLGAGKGLKSIKDTLHYALLVTKDYVVYGWKLVTTYNAQERAAIKAAAAQKGLNKAMLANVWTALAVAVGVLIYKIYEWNKAVSETEKELARMSVEEEHARHNLDNLVNSLNKATTSADAAKKKHEDLKGETEALRKEVDTLSKSADKNSEAKSKLSEKTQELEKKEKDLKAAEDESNKANGERLKLINEINSKYSTYLGYMLTEATNAEKVASAHQLIIAALKEEMRQKGIVRKQQAIDEKYQKDEEEYSRDSWQELDRLPRATQQRIMDAWTEVRASITSDIDKNGKQTFSLSAIPGLKNSGKTFSSEGELKEYMKQALTEIVGREVPTVSLKGSNARYINFGTEKKRNLVGFDSFIEDIWGGKTDDGFGDWATTTIEKQGEITRELQEDKITKDTDHRKTVSAAINDINTSFKIISETATGNQDLTAKQINTLAENVNAIVVDLKKYDGEIKNVDKYVGKDNEVSLENAINTMLASLTEKQRKQILNTAKRVSRSGAGGGGSTTPAVGGNVWGSNAPADSTDYGTWDVNELVARRNQMDKFKNVLKPDTDIRAVLAEDKALMKALDNGLKEDWKSVIGWYNTERKKIQEELKSERFSTNTGHWRDEKDGRGRRNRFRESDYALAELDRYYSKRKENLEKARIEENMSEELFNRQAELLEQEHLERRSKLRETFTAGSTEQEKKMVKQFREWWNQLEKQGLLDDVPWATVESEWSKALASEIGRNNLRAQQDLTKLQEITVKHLNEIAKLIDKERPYDGITANLRKNLTEMDILLADLQKDGPEKDTAKLVKAETIRLKFLLSEAEQAYSLNFEQLKEKMIKEGFGEWAQAIEGDEQLKQSLMQNLRNTYDAIQEAIKKESSVIKKQLEIQWNDMMPGSDMSMKGMFEKAVSDLGLAGDQVKRANSLIGAGTASDRVADKLAIQQMRIQLQMQETYFALMQKIGRERIKQLEQSAVANEREAKALKEKADLLRKEGKTAEAEVTELKAQNTLRQSLQDKFDAEHAAKSLSLARTKELAEEEKQREEIIARTEESQNRLYTELKSWADLLSSSLQSVFEASHTGDAEYYNELAKMNLQDSKRGRNYTKEEYVVIDNAGTSEATAHYEYLNEREALDRQHEIERDNAVADAWKKMWDDLNAKMSETITDQMNALLQNASIDANTQATLANTSAIAGLTSAMGNQSRGTVGTDGTGQVGSPTTDGSTPSVILDPNNVGLPWEQQAAAAEASAERQVTAIDKVNTALDGHFHKQISESDKANKQMTAGTQSAFAKMTQAANLYGIAYQAMSNDNLSTEQKFQMFAIQAAGQAAITSLTTSGVKMVGDTAVQTPSILSKIMAELGPIAGPIAFGAFTALLGGLMGLATSKLAKSKSQIAQITGASSSLNAGRISTGMLTYGEGNVNEFTDPASLTPGRSYNVDGANGKTYRAKYMGKNPRTHITNGPEFHLVGEEGQEAIIDAKTTRQIRMDDNGIWKSIQVLYNGGRISSSRRRRMGRGMPAFADGNIGEFEDMDGLMNGGDNAGGFSMEQMLAFQQSLDRNSEVMERLANEGIEAFVSPYGKRGIVNGYDQYKKEAQRHGEKYL